MRGGGQRAAVQERLPGDGPRGHLGGAPGFPGGSG